MPKVTKMPEIKKDQACPAFNGINETKQPNRTTNDDSLQPYLEKL
jgi:hypothetical protein